MGKRLEAIRNTWCTEDDRGAVLFVLTLFLVIFIMVAAVAVDLAATGARAQTLQNSSDAAALAAVVEYQEVLLETADEAAAAAAAKVTLEEVLLQNGLDPADPALDVGLEVNHDGTQLTVTITDNNPDEFLPSAFLGDGVKPGDGTVTRQATAEYLGCERECSLIITIPQPFGGIRAKGSGDGFQPISVGTRLYAINHNAIASNGDRHIVCVDRVRQAPCWAGDVFRQAYADSVGYSEPNPEMVHTAVVGSRIYWAATDASGLRLFCWQTGTGPGAIDYPCPEAVMLDPTLERADFQADPNGGVTSQKDENRGSGTVAVDDKVYVFADNHRIHCFDPATGSICAGFGSGGKLTSLGVANFPPADPADGNHGSSIDRIVADGKIYSTIHIPNAQPAFSCTTPLPDPAGRRVLIQNEVTGNYLVSSAPGSVTTSADGSTEDAWWDTLNFGSETVIYQSASHGEYLAPGGSPFATTTVGFGEENRWNHIPNVVTNDSYSIDSEFGANLYGVLRENTANEIVEEPSPASSPGSFWNFYDSRCGDPSATSSLAPSPDYFGSGTWLHCFDTNLAAPCADFQVKGLGGADSDEPSPLHVDGSRFSGRLWFYYGADGDPTDEIDPPTRGVCSSGYNQNWEQPGLMDPSSIEVVCVDMEGNNDAGLATNLRSVETAIQGSTGFAPAAWGTPHWNPATNRLFYPTEHNVPLIICFDFDDGPCDNEVGSVTLPSTDADPNPSPQFTEDYGFVSDGDCVYGLGHTALFWAFKADDVSERCDVEPTPSVIQRCPCGDGQTFRWGDLDFSNIPLEDFSSFAVRIVTSVDPDAVQLFPALPAGQTASYHVVTPENSRIPLQDIIPSGMTKVWAEVYTEGGGEEIGQFEISFRQRPRLVG